MQLYNNIWDLKAQWDVNPTLLLFFMLLMKYFHVQEQADGGFLPIRFTTSNTIAWASLKDIIGLVTKSYRANTPKMRQRPLTSSFVESHVPIFVGPKLRGKLTILEWCSDFCLVNSSHPLNLQSLGTTSWSQIPSQTVPALSSKHHTILVCWIFRNLSLSHYTGSSVRAGAVSNVVYAYCSSE